MKKLSVCLLAALLLLLCAGALAGEKYAIEVDVTSQIVTVYDADDRTSTGIVRQMLCSTGKDDSTPIGSFKLIDRYSTERKKWMYIDKYECYVQYATRIKGHILFHSIPYNKKDTAYIDEEALAELGKPASHGCVRLLSDDAKWIAENCPKGTECRIFRSGNPQTMLREQLALGTYSRDSSMTYLEFLGYSQDPTTVSRASSQTEIREVQQLLQYYGYYTGNLNGMYTAELPKAVCAAQEAAGLRMTGLCDAALREKLLAGEIPVSHAQTLHVGMKSLAVKEVQQALAQGGWYNGLINGIYSAALDRALESYTQENGYESGCSPEVQAVLLCGTQSAATEPKVLDEVKLTPGPGITAFTTGSVNLRADASAVSEKLACAQSGTQVSVLEKGSEWSRVICCGKTGYMKSKYLTFSDTVQES